MEVATEPLLDQKQAAQILGIEPRTMENWRVRGFGPAHYKVGGRVRYDARDLRAWLEERRRESTSDPVPAEAD